MSNYTQPTKHPETGEILDAEWIDDYFGRHKYGVRFPDGKIFHARQIESPQQPQAVHKPRQLDLGIDPDMHD